MDSKILKLRRLGLKYEDIGKICNLSTSTVYAMIKKYYDENEIVPIFGAGEVYYDLERISREEGIELIYVEKAYDEFNKSISKYFTFEELRELYIHQGMAVSQIQNKLGVKSSATIYSALNKSGLSKAALDKKKEYEEKIKNLYRLDCSIQSISKLTKIPKKKIESIVEGLERLNVFGNGSLYYNLDEIAMTTDIDKETVYTAYKLFNRRISTISFEEVRQLVCIEKLKLREIANRLNISTQLASHIVKTYGLKLNTRIKTEKSHAEARHIIESNKDDIVSKIERGYNYSKIAREYGIDEEVFRYIRKEVSLTDRVTVAKGRYEEVSNLLKDGYTYKQIQEITGCNCDTVCKVASRLHKEEGFTSPNRKPSILTEDPKQLELAVRMYKQGYAISSIARKLNTPYHNVYSKLKSENIV